jgi:ABC-type sugar transport system permease subunit
VEVLGEDVVPPISVEGFDYLSPAEAETALADRESLEFAYPFDTVPIMTVPEDLALTEGYRYDPAQALFVDYNGSEPEAYQAFLFASDSGAYLLWLVPERGEPILARTDGPVVIDGLPQTIGDYRILSNRERIAVTQELPKLTFGDPDNPIYVDAFSATRAGRFRQLYEYNEDKGTFQDRVTGAIYREDEGNFVLDPTSVPADVAAEITPELSPGWYVVTGFDNFDRLLTDERLRGPFVRIFLWTVAHAFLAVFLTFSLGLALALLMNDKMIPQRKLLRSLILIPYAIPAFISTLVWRGLLNPRLGLINDTLEKIIGSGNAPAWYSSPTWAKVGILLIQLWLGFPYMMLICTGALQALPSDIYEAAEVDGANSWQRFRSITLPLLLVAVGPLLIASFAFNFNNFTVIELFNEGNPPIANSSVPAGHTDILITYTYAQAFGSGGGTDYAFASAISIFIFMIVAAITIFNFRFTRAWEETSRNV